MAWNDTKFNLLRIGHNKSLKDNTIIMAPKQKIIEQSEYVKDLGVLFDKDLNFKIQRNKAHSGH